MGNVDRTLNLLLIFSTISIAISIGIGDDFPIEISKTGEYADPEENPVRIKVDYANVPPEKSWEPFSDHYMPIYIGIFVLGVVILVWYKCGNCINPCAKRQRMFVLITTVCRKPEGFEKLEEDTSKSVVEAKPV